MSQVRKFAQGGGNPESSSNQTSTKHKPYKITIDGVVQELDDQDLANWASAYSTSTNSQQRIGLNDVINSIKRGNNVSYNSLKNTFTGVNWTNQDIINNLNLNRTNPNQRQAERQKRRWARRDSRRGDARQQWMVGMQEAMRYNFNPIQSQQTETPSEDNRTALYGDDSSWFDYNTDDKGNVTFSTGPENAGYLQRLKNFETFLNLSEDEADKQYSWDDENDRYIQDLRTAWASNQTSENPFTFSGLIERIRANQLNETDLDWLKWMGFDKDSRKDNTDSAQQTVVPRSWEGSGFNDALLEQNNYYVRKDNEGNTYLYTTNAQGELVPVQDSIYLKGTPWARGTQWEGGAIYGGRFYNQNDVYDRNSTVGQAIQSQLFNQLAGLTNPEDIRQAALNSGWQVYGTENPFNISADNTFISGQSYLPGFTDIFNNGTYYWTDITNQYNAPEGTTILTYLNPNNRDRDNFLREQYAIYHNGQSQIFDNIEKLQNYLNRPDVGITQAEHYNYGNPIRQWGYTTENGTRYYDLGKRYIIPGDENSAYSVLRDNLGNYYVTLNNGQKQLLKGRAILEKIKNGTVTAQELQNGHATEDNRKTFGNDNAFFGINVGTRNKDPYEPGSYDQFFGFYKKGGKIQSKQIGGLFSTGSYGKQKEYKPVESNIGSPQKLNADKRLKTSTDQAELTGGILDAAGLATSWIPGLGAAIGALGSLSHFVADVKKDGFQWSDAGKLAGNLALDALTFVPGVGFVAKAAKTGVKTAKAAKRADKVAKALNRTRPALATAGAISGGAAIKSAVEDLQNNEFTSESMGKLLTGVGQATLGSLGLGKLYKTAKTIKNLNKTPIKDKFEVKPDDKKIKKTAKKVGNVISKGSKKAGIGFSSTIKLMYNPKKTEALISQNWETLARSSNSYANRLAAEYLNKFGSQTIGNTTYSGIRVGPNWMYNRFRLNKTANTTTNAAVNTTPQIINPIKTNKEKYSPEEKALRKSIAELLHKIRNVKTSEGTKSLVMDVGFRGKGFNGKTIPNRFDAAIKARPELRNMIQHHIDQDRYFHGTGIDDFIKRFNLSFKKGGIIKAQGGTDTSNWDNVVFRNGHFYSVNPEMNVFNNPPVIQSTSSQSTTQPFTLVMNNTNTNPYFNYERGGIKFDSNGNVDWNATYGDNSDYMNYRQYYIDNWNNPEFQAAKQAYLRQLQEKGVKTGSLNKSYIKTDPKTGRSVSINPDAYNLNDPTISTVYDMSLDEFKRLTNDERLGYAHDLYNDAFGRIYKPAQSPNAPEINIDSIEIPDEDLQVEIEDLNLSIPQLTANYVDENGRIIEDGLNPSSYTPKVNTFDPQLLFGAAELARSIATNNYMFKKMKEANKLIQKEMPTEIYDRYQDHITPAYQNAAQQKRQFFVPTSTDALTNYTMRQMNEDQARQLELEGNLKASEQYSQWLQNDLAARRAYAQDRRETALFNRQEMLNKLLRDAQIDQGRIAANNQSIANFAMEGRNWFHQKRQRALDAISQYDNAVAQNNYELDMRNAGQSYFNEFMNMTPEQRAENGGDWMYFWQTRDPQGYNAAQTAAFAKLQNARLHNRGLDVQWPYKIPTILAKKGGTLKYQQRHTGQKPDEAIWINRNKETAKALEKLHDAVIKLFMKSIS